MCGGGDPEIKETPAQRELARIGLERYQSYKAMYEPVRQQLFDKVDYYGTREAQQRAGGHAAAAVESSFGQAIRDDVAAMASQGTGVNPSSGVHQQAATDHAARAATARSETVNQAEQAIQDAHLAGKQNIIAIGNNQSTQAIQGMGQVASNSASVASSDARREHTDNLGDQAAIGMAVGAGYGVHTNTREDRPNG
ncbi:MAG: hypothetical protein AAGI44_01405 [Pseudomonadota bacterium]